MDTVEINGIKKLFENSQIFDIQDDKAIKFIKNFKIPDDNDLAILCVQNEKAELSENEHDQLERILNYLKKSFDNTPVIVCTKDNPVSFQQLKNTIPFKKLIIFGGSRVLQGLNIDTVSGYKAIKIDGIVFFFSHNLSELEADEKKKRMLKPALDELIAT
jgi:hypothetical protein